MKTLSAATLAVAVGLSAFAAQPAPARRVVNIVNFVRACEPRFELDLVKPLAEEIWFNTHYGFKNTILMQYDALLDEKLLKTALSADRAKTEYGIWFEVVQPLCDKLGIPWRGRWAWDWTIVPDCTMAYSVRDRERLADEVMRLATEKFGKKPVSVGAWLLDAHTMAYLSEKWGVQAFCICREQDNTDCYGLRGGYSNGAYYPSRLNMLSAARDMKNAIPTPVFKMLTPDPIYNYSWPHELYPGSCPGGGCPTMEPVWFGGYNADVVDWYFRTYLKAPGLLNLSYMQVGQENSFSWPSISLGLSYQMKSIAYRVKRGEVEVETLGETARRFKADHPANCPQTQVALEDWSKNGRNSVWYNSRAYRANLFLDKGRLAFRDIHQMLDDYREPCFDTPCTEKKLDYFTPPFVDTYLDRDKNLFRGDLAFDGTFAALAVETPDDRTLVVTATRTYGTLVKIRFEETRITVEGATLEWSVKPSRRREVFYADGRLNLEFRGYRHSLAVDAKVSPTYTGLKFAPVANSIVFTL